MVPERKPLFRQNPNIEILNPKQIRISNDKMTQNNTLTIRSFCHWDIGILVIVSYFVFRASDFEFIDRKNRVFGQALNIRRIWRFQGLFSCRTGNEDRIRPAGLGKLSFDMARVLS